MRAIMRVNTPKNLRREHMSEKTVISYQIPPLKQPTFPHPEYMIISDLTQLFDNKQGKYPNPN